MLSRPVKRVPALPIWILEVITKAPWSLCELCGTRPADRAAAGPRTKVSEAFEVQWGCYSALSRENDALEKRGFQPPHRVKCPEISVLRVSPPSLFPLFIASIMYMSISRRVRLL